MNIQINCNNKINENELRYIYHNINGFIEQYQRQKDDYRYSKYKNGKRVWEYVSEGNMFLKTKIIITCNGKTIYFKVKEV